MEHLNYCRQIKQQISRLLEVPSIDGERRAVFAHIHDLCCVSTKFILPFGGLVLDDGGEMRALSEGFIRLPYDFVAIEFEGALNNKRFKMALLCANTEVDGSPRIMVRPVSYGIRDGSWRIEHSFTIEGIARDKGETEFIVRSKDKLGDSPAFFSRVVGAFINAMSCSNVHAELSEPKKATKKIKTALPFDTYHILTIDVPGAKPGSGGAAGSHRSPREHLRRGHIRRYESGLKVWVNACVVSAGAGGKVTKDYRLREVQHASQ